MDKLTINVVGAGLAGCEAAWQAAERGAHVRLYEMKPQKKIPAHSSEDFCELCCSNSFRAEGLSNAIGLLKEELRAMGSLVMKCADATRVPAGGALAVDRDAFPKMVTEHIKNHPNIEIIAKEITSLDRNCIGSAHFRAACRCDRRVFRFGRAPLFRCRGADRFRRKHRYG